MAISHIHIGTNQGDLSENLKKAIALLNAKGNIIDRSHVYETEAWGKKDQPNFYNMAIAFDTNLEPHDLLDYIHDVEDQLGRVRNEKWGERIIDIDIITYDDKIIYDSKLEIPHRHMSERNFVLVPLMEIASDWIHPKQSKTIEELYMQCHDTCEVLLTDIIL